MSKLNPFLKGQTTAANNPFMKKALEKAKVAANEDQPNVFLKKPKGREKEKFQGTPKMTEADWAALRKQAWAKLQATGVKVGDEVAVTWDYYLTEGSDTGTFVGKVTKLNESVMHCDDEDSNTHLNLPITAINHVNIKRTAKHNPFLHKAKT